MKFFLSFLILCVLAGCQTVDLYERVVTIPGHAWEGKYRPQFRFEIRDTASPYQLFVILRHNNRYNYNNIWINLHTVGPGIPPARVHYELPLATNERGWLGSGMDDLYEHRIALTPAGENFYFRKAGVYTFTLEQIMRENPLQHVMNVGLRLEKKTQ